MSLPRKLISLLFITSSIVYLFAQESRTWKIDSIQIYSDNAASWVIDSVHYMSASETKNILIQPLPDCLQTTVSGASIFSNGDFAPFWLTNNQHGIGTSDTYNGHMRINTFLSKNFSNINVSGNIDLVAGYNLNSNFYIQQLYAELKYKSIRFTAGAKEKKSLLKNDRLSSGGLTLSENARPIPQFEFSIPEFVPIPNTNDKFEIMGGVSYGWYTDNRFKKKNAADGYYATDVLYHRKYGFVKYKPNNIWNFIAGLEMDTQWGGHFYKNWQYWNKSSAKLKYFFKVLVPMSGGSDSNITDKVNIVGNVYGSIHFISEFKKEKYTIKAYHEHFFEDHSGLIFKNIPDGLYGIEFNMNKKSWISAILLEYLHTKDQSGPFLWDKNETIPIQVSGGDNYYNQIDYISLSNYGYVLGNPFFTSPIYNRGASLTIYNSRLSAFHGGVSGNLSTNICYRLLISYSRSWGTPLIPSINIRNQFSSMIEATYQCPKLYNMFFSAAFAFDKSSMVGDNIGLQVKVSKTFHIPVK